MRVALTARFSDQGPSSSVLCSGYRALGPLSGGEDFLRHRASCAPERTSPKVRNGIRDGIGQQ